MKARATGINTILDAVKKHPALSGEQKKDLIDGYREFTEKIAAQALKDLNKKYNKELTAEALIVLHEEFGFGEERLKKFVKAHRKIMTECAIELNGIESVCVVAMSKLEDIYPNCEEWFTDKVPCSDCEGQDICQAGFYEQCDELTDYLK